MSARGALAVALVVAASSAACSTDTGAEPVGSDAPAGTTTTTMPTTTTMRTTTTTRILDTRPFDVTVRTETFVDTSRPTIRPGGVEVAASRTLVTDVYVPDGPGPFPLLVHAHGLDGNRTKFTQLLATWAGAGYVVAAPTFPLTSNESDPVVVVDHENQPADVSFVIDEVLAALGGTVDAARIGVSGLSLGSSAAYGTGYHACCRDDRVDAIVVMNGLRFPLPRGDYALGGIPLLISHTTGDARLAYAEAVKTFEAKAGDRFLLTLEGPGHAEPYEDAPSPFDDVVEEVTVDFWDLVLLGDPDARERMRDHAEVEGVSSLRS